MPFFEKLKYYYNLSKIAWTLKSRIDLPDSPLTKEEMKDFLNFLKLYKYVKKKKAVTEVLVYNLAGHYRFSIYIDEAKYVKLNMEAVAAMFNCSDTCLLSYGKKNISLIRTDPNY